MALGVRARIGLFALKCATVGESYGVRLTVSDGEEKEKPKEELTSIEDDGGGCGLCATVVVVQESAVLDSGGSGGRDHGE
jgi:hypothetical protein